MRLARKTLFVLIILAAVLSGCSQPAPAPAATQAPAVPTTAPAEPTTAPAVPTAIKQAEATVTPAPTVAAEKYKEAPMLAELVKAGKLPPVDQRLPDEPMVVTPVDEVGKYGGTWHEVASAPAISNIRLDIYDPPIRWLPDYTGYAPNMVTDWEWSDDGKTLTFHWRKGMKWSDGEPFTMEDLKFWWEDLCLNPDIKSVKPRNYMFKSDGKTPIDISFPDDYTMVWKSDQPQYVQPYFMAQGYWEWEPMMKPKHYLQQFVAKYNPNAKPEDFDKAIKWYENPDFPVLFAWHVTKFVSGERTVFERNPYYWKVDTEGNQLPYIDTLEVELVPDKETRTLKISQGLYTTWRGTEDPRDIPFLLEQAEAGKYTLYDGWTKGGGAWPTWLINQDYTQTGDPATDTSADQEIRDILRNKIFRQALSLSMDRQRMIDVVWEGVGEPKAFTISPQAWHFASDEGKKVYQEWAASFAQYDSEQAAKMLDGIGMKKAADGWRTTPSGKPFELIIDVGDWGGDKIALDGSQALVEQLQAVGVKTRVNNLVGQPDFGVRQQAGNYMLLAGDASEVDLWTLPGWVFPYNYARAWPMAGTYRSSGGAKGWKPEAGSPAEQLLKLFDAGLREGDAAKREQYIYDAIKIHETEGPFYLAFTGDRQVPVVIQNNFHNVPKTGIVGPWAPSSPGNKFSEQFWIGD